MDEPTGPPPLGVIEGFFGVPWGWADRAALVDFLGGQGFDFYIYAPKADRHLRHAWRDPWPAAATARLAGVAGHCRDRGLTFGAGLSPFGIHGDFGPAARADLRRAVRRISRAWPDMLCLLFDDMPGGAPDLAEIQADAAAEIAATSTARTFLFCPTYYSFDPQLESTFGEAPARYLPDIGRRLDAGIGILWTGPNVRSPSYPADHLRHVAGLLGRKPFLWDNHLANDGETTSNHLYLETATRAPDLTNRLTAGCAVNPMNQPYLSRLPLSAIAAGGTFAEVCTALCGEALGAEIAGDGRRQQDDGRAALAPDERAALAKKYQSFGDNGYASELAAWLRGAYPFDPACLTG